MRMPGWMPKPSSAAAETSPTNCSRPGSGASAAGPLRSAARAPAATTSSNRGRRTQTTDIEHMFASPGDAIKAGVCHGDRAARCRAATEAEWPRKGRYRAGETSVARPMRPGRRARSVAGQRQRGNSMSRRAIVILLAGLALALAAGVVIANAKQSQEKSPAFADQLASARLATAKYATNLGQAKADGYKIITRMIPDMGWHFMNPDIKDFDLRRPPILVYERKGRTWQLGALEW